MAKDLNAMSPDEVCGWIQKQIRNIAGDDVENKTDVYASHGYYYVYFPLFAGLAGLDHIWRRSRLPELVKQMRAAMKAEKVK